MTKKKQSDFEVLQADGYLSDESDFYGSPSTKASFESRASAFDPLSWWESKRPTLMEVSSYNLETSANKRTAKLYNPYAGLPSARQLSETVEEFLVRLPPSNTPVSEDCLWIWIASPYRKIKLRSGASQSQSQTRASQVLQLDAETEAPPAGEEDREGFARAGTALLDELFQSKAGIEQKSQGKAKGTVTKLVNKAKEGIVQGILDAAIKHRYTSGKWMIFAPPAEVDLVWGAIAKAVANNDLGIAAKVAPFEGDPRKERLICIYTYDFTDLEDITRVAKKLKEIGVLDMRGRGIYYKCDAYTILGLSSDNPYGIKASLYDSNKVLKGEDVKIEGFFCKKKKEPGSFKAVEYE